MGDTTPIPGPSRGLSGSANFTVLLKFVPEQPVAMATKIRKFRHIIDNNSACLGDTAPISGHNRGLCESANLTVQLNFVPVSWYHGSANLMASFKCSTLSHPTGDRFC